MRMHLCQNTLLDPGFQINYTHIIFGSQIMKQNLQMHGREKMCCIDYWVTFVTKSKRGLLIDTASYLSFAVCS